MHPVRKLLLAFEDRDDFPIEPDDVRKWIIDNGYCEGFIVHYVDCDPLAFDGIYVERQGGELIRHDVPYGEPKRMREIFINVRLPRERQRIAEVKESIHILDAIAQQTSTIEDINKMVAYAAKKVKLSADNGALADFIAFPQALAVLFPYECRRLLLPSYAQGKLSADEIAQVAELPEAYVELVMSPEWDDNYVFFVGFGEDVAEED